MVEWNFYLYYLPVKHTSLTEHLFVENSKHGTHEIYTCIHYVCVYIYIYLCVYLLMKSEKGDWKSWLKTQHSKNEDHGIRSHNFMANRWGTMKRVRDFIFMGSKITADGDCSHEIKRHLLLGRKVMTNLDSILKNRDTTLPIKVRLSNTTCCSTTVKFQVEKHIKYHLIQSQLLKISDLNLRQYLISRNKLWIKLTYSGKH